MTFSIIIPVYNVAPYLRECLDSVLAQTYTDWEAICVDDGSTDGSGEILDEYARRDRRFCVIHQKNAGVSAARNKGLDIASGEWIWFVDGDDIISANSLRIIADVIAKVGNFDAIRFEYTKQKQDLGQNSNILELTASDVHKAVAVRDVDSFLWQVVYKAECAQKVRFRETLVRGEDRVFATEFMLLNCGSYARITNQLYFYRQRESSAMHNRIVFKIVRSEIDFRIEQLHIVDGTTKKIDANITKNWIGWFFEGPQIEMIEECDKDEKTKAYSHWYSVARELSKRNDLNQRVIRKARLDAIFSCRIVTMFIYRRNKLMDKMIGKLKQIDCLRRLVQSVRASRTAFKKAWHSYVGKVGGKFELSLTLRGNYSFDNRSKKSRRLLIILAGYKSELWGTVFGRVGAFVPADLDVCIITSGKVVDELRNLCVQRNWSYLSTERNNLCLAQNIAINLHPAAEMIYKIDEDIFLTEGFFDRLEDAYSIVPKRFNMDVGFVAPLLPVNGYGHVRLLKRLGLEQEWESRFGALVHTEGLYRHKAILENPDAARFMWGAWNEELRGIDRLNAHMLKVVPKEDAVSICPHRFSIGAILFSREVWKEIGMFPVAPDGTGLGGDEEALCVHCMLRSRAIAVVENSVVGHLAFGPQTKGMLDFFRSKHELFELPCDTVASNMKNS